MRSTRVYQAATPAARIMDIIANNTGQHFDRHLVRRFTHLMGVYPAATLVRLTDGSVGIVVDGGGAADPVIKVLLDRDGARLDVPVLTRLGPGGQTNSAPRALAIDAPLDPALFDLDPADYL